MNIIKARCKCGSRATIIRTKPIDAETTILTARCDDENCQRVFQVSVTFHSEIIPPVPSIKATSQRQFTIFENC
ncbi:hypothetical protein KKI24_24395 [bacterium]|nr:hypothetical protein [bacterium]